MASEAAQQVSTGHRSLQLAGRTQRDVAPVIDDGEAMRQCISLFHIVRGQQDRLPLWLYSRMISHSSNRVCGSSRGAGLVEEKHLRIVHHGTRNGENCATMLLVESAHHLDGAVAELEPLQQAISAPGALLGPS